MAKKNDLNAALLKSLKPSKTVVESKPEKPTSGVGESQPSEPKPTARKGAAKKKLPAKRGIVLRQNVTLFAKDVEVIDRITDQLAKHGIRRVPLSACIRIALRLSGDDPAKVKAIYEQIREEDGRTRDA